MFDSPVMTHRQIASVMGCSEWTIRQIEKSAFAKLQTAFEANKEEIVAELRRRDAGDVESRVFGSRLRLRRQDT